MALLKQAGAPSGLSPGSRCLLGRHAACDVRLDDPLISGEHASLHWRGDRWELRDLGSRNGTFMGERRLDAGERTPLREGATFRLGSTQVFTLADASPPVPSARHARSGAVRSAAEGLLVLPDDDHPDVTLFEDATGRWVAEDGEALHVVADRDIVIVDGEGWVLDLPNLEGGTWEAGAAFGPTLESIALRFQVSLDEEHVEVAVAVEGRVTALPPRTHHYLLLTLARARLDDQAASPAERGWVDRDALCRMLATDTRTLNVDVFRARRQLASLGLHGAVGIIERRPSTGQVRLGTDRVEVERL